MTLTHLTFLYFHFSANIPRYKYLLAKWIRDSKSRGNLMDRLLLRETACLCKCNCTRELSHMLPNDSPFSKSRGLESGNGSTRRTCIIARSMLITSETRSVYKRAMSNKTKQIIYINCYAIFHNKNLYRTDRWEGCSLFHGANYR